MRRFVRSWSSRNAGAGLYAAMGILALAGCSKSDGRAKTDQSQIAEEQVDSTFGRAQQALTWNGDLWVDNFTQFNASANKPATPFRGVNGGAPTSAQADWYITQNFTA